MKWLPILIFLALSPFVLGKGPENKINKTFVATKDWQEIEEGQPIPHGLHVRINLQTGKKEAKLLDENETDTNAARETRENAMKSSSLAMLPESDSETATGVDDEDNDALRDLRKSKILTDEIKRTLANNRPGLEYSPEQIEKIKKRFKSLKEIQESFDEVRKNFKTDAEIITVLIDEFRNLSKSEAEGITPTSKQVQQKINTQLQILEKFYFMVDQIDNAQWFIDAGGLEQILLPLVVNQTNMGLRVQALQVLGALTQNNPKSQIKVFELNLGAHLSQILISSTHTEELSAALLAIGGLLRRFPLAQKRILSTSGTQALVTLLSKECDLKLKARAVTLISDLIVEKRFALTAENDKIDAALQYAELNFEEWLQANEYCDTFEAMMSTELYQLLDQPELVEYFSQALQLTHEHCLPVWSKSGQLRHVLLTLRNRFLHSKDEYRVELAAQLNTLIETLFKTEKHDEL